MKTETVFTTPIGNLRLTEEKGAVTGLCFTEETPRGEESEAVRQLKAYFSGARRTFDLPLETGGTPFQKRIWAALRAIPFGETRTYGQIARAIGSPGAARAVGMACNRNPVLILIPCHRVVGANGALTGFAGGLDKKEYLLKLEAQVN
jgi:methylated-DNA-[protein]-cysteine S-methyltransferase